MTAFTIELTVDAQTQHEVRDLANDVRAAIRTAQKQGRYAGVTVTGGPAILTSSGRDPRLESKPFDIETQRSVER